MRNSLKLAFMIGLVGLGAQGAAIAAADPKGDGPPDAKACRRSEAATGSIVSGPDVCLTNKQWIALHTSHQTISADGKHVVKANGPNYYPIQDQFMGEDRDMVPRGDTMRAATP